MRKTLLALAATLLACGASAQTLDRIKQTGAVNFGIRPDAAPLSFVGADGQPDGYTPAICDRIAQALADVLEIEELTANFISVSADERFDKVASGELDLLCGAATITLPRREIVDFSVPVYVDGASLVVPRDAGENLSDLAGKRVGFRSGTTTEEAVRNSFENAGIEAELIPFQAHPAGFQAMIDGALDAYFADQSILLVNFVSAQMSEEFKMSDQILTVEKQGLAMARGDTEFRLFVDTVLSELYADGTMREIFREALPGIRPGPALEAMYLIAPTLR
ncbi:amino acid ABC transporter substrate-binding protein, PAAT family [Cribrihabitans marinus]|uniref:Amino acid ABC transporter substrate-binding protein, PAAT family n=1 Tax=Cribrihabitans marinus TaxID=1227549 RepID=A0A1H6VGV9_9RHOB|nr:amino acid ABC transporter substrate-binding protein [Cribrihabitans marinus]GGH26273.1 amino acid ABC transporter substrate-binding protein [Cribrihabitans marinus]SEI99930.1 amino acid ABC transporter substrate-binding protein, PAAT family [Cribrihabitans marinus]